MSEGVTEGMSDERSDPRSPFVRNLIVLLVVGVAVLAWVLRYTDWFPAIGGVLALGGALSWMAFVSRLLKKERLEHLQNWADRAIFDNPRTAPRVAVLAAILFAVACFVGTLELHGPAGSSLPRNVVLREGDSEDRARLKLKGTLRQPVLTSWWAPRRVHVKLGGYPEATDVVAPWSRTTLVAPDEFLREVVVLRPDEELLKMVANNPMPLVVRLASRPAAPYRVEGYRGQTVWIGCDEDVDVPADVLESWKAELVSRNQIRQIHLWSRPMALPNGPASLVSGDRLRVEVLSGPTTVYAQADVVVRPVRSPRDFPQQEEIHALAVVAPSPNP